MGTLLGLLGLVFFAVCVIVAAAGVTWLVVRLTPSRAPKSDAASS